VVQEFILGKHVILIFGRWLSWSNFDAWRLENGFLRAKSESMYAEGPLLASKSRILHILRLAHGREFLRNPMSLASALFLYPSLACTDPRDKIYGLLALVAPSEKVELDYSRPTSSIYWDAVAIIAKDHSLVVNSDWLVKLRHELGVTDQEPNACAFVKRHTTMSDETFLVRFSWPDGVVVRPASTISPQALQVSKRNLRWFGATELQGLAPLN
jgi:hypothetical protein